MPLAYSNEENHPLIVALCDEAIRRGANLNIDVRDEMMLHLVYRDGEDRDSGLVTYLQSGMLIWDTLRGIAQWWFGDLSRVGQVLDFASGYGRVTRFLVCDLPPERVWVSDIYPEGVRFQEEQFGVHGLVSTARPEDFACSQRFDWILVSSLFTHLPEATFGPWLDRLAALLAPGGLLVFTTHGDHLLRPDRSLGPSGLRFEPMSESASLAGAEYGSTWVSESYVRACLARALPGSSALCVPRGLVNYQDLWVVVDRPEADFSGLDVRAAPEGYVEHCSINPSGRMQIAGWVVDRVTREPVREVRAELDGVVAARTGELFPREDVDRSLPWYGTRAQGWRLELTPPPGLPRGTAYLVLHATDGRGRDSVLAASSLETALLRSARLDLLGTRAQLADAREEIARLGASEERLGWEVAVRDARLAAMEASRFWKLRQGWFALKRRLGLRAEG
jgi:SAM-dependent methyltransferase